MPEALIRDAGPEDVAAIAAIYNAYVSGSIATFELDPVSCAAMHARIGDAQARGLPWLVADDGGAVLGYAYATPWKARAAYARSVETSVYVAGDATGHGLGRRLQAALLGRLRASGLHVALAGIVLPNPASVALHASLGFVHAGTLREVGFKFGRWLDVGYWQYTFADAQAGDDAPARPAT